MNTSFIGACLMGVALSLQLRGGLELPQETLNHSEVLAQTANMPQAVCH
jgi:hypothetical protein